GHSVPVEEVKPLAVVVVFDGPRAFALRRDEGSDIMAGERLLIVDEPRAVYDPDDMKQYLGCTQMICGVALVEAVRERILELCLIDWANYTFHRGLWVQREKECQQ